MNQYRTHDILKHPEFQKMAHRKAVLSWSFSALMLIVYVVFILLIGLSPSTMSTPIADNSLTTWGIVIGISVIIFAFILTAIFVRKANGEFDQLTKKVIDEVQGDKL